MPSRHAFHDGSRRAPYPDVHDGNPFPRGGPPPPRPPPPAVYEEEIEFQMGEIRRLVGDNRRLADNCAGLQRELAMAKEEIHRLNIFIQDVRADKDAQIRDLIEKGMKMEADLRAAEPLRNEVALLRADLQKLKSIRQEQVQGLTQELSRSQADAKQAHALKGEIDVLRQELMRVRSHRLRLYRLLLVIDLSTSYSGSRVKLTVFHLFFSGPHWSMRRRGMQNWSTRGRQWRRIWFLWLASLRSCVQN